MIGLALPEPTWAHRLAAGAKLGALLVATLLVFPLTDPAALALAFATTLALLASLGRPAVRAILRAFRPVVPFIAFAAAIHLWQGRPEAALTMALRMAVLWSLAMAVTMTTRLDDMVGVIERLAAPLARVGLPPRALGLSVALVLRFIPVFLDRWDRLTAAWRTRSPRRPGPRLIAPLLISVLDDAMHVSDAIAARGGVTPLPQRSPDDGTQSRPDRPLR